ncbi:hypothetical protein [Paenibacillus sp. GCM10012306]|uniref:hypothetical protein n=1 Tax=Paenibacillus sp. GCM10012306 TaxID=3317342 RepID=UPI00361AACC4
MAEKNVLIKKHNGLDWDNIYPVTKGNNVVLTSGGSVEDKFKQIEGGVTTSKNGLMLASDKSKLDGIAAGANNYTHPATHPASIISQDTSNRFVTDAEKTTWNSKASTAVATTGANGLMSSADKVALANNTGFGTTTGTPTAYTLALSPAPTALVAGLRFSFVAHTASGSNPTINPNGLGAKSILKPNGSAGKLSALGVYTVIYSGTSFILQGEGGENEGTAKAEDVLIGKTFQSAESPTLNVGALADGSGLTLPGVNTNSQEKFIRVRPSSIGGNTKGVVDLNTMFEVSIPTLLASNIKDGVIIAGVRGTYVAPLTRPRVWRVDDLYRDDEVVSSINAMDFGFTGRINGQTEDFIIRWQDGSGRWNEVPLDQGNNDIYAIKAEQEGLFIQGYDWRWKLINWSGKQPGTLIAEVRGDSMVFVKGDFIIT